MIDRISNQNVSNSTRITAIEKVNPIQKTEDVLKNHEKKANEEQAIPVKKEKIEEVVKGMNDFIQPVNTSLKFVLHEKLNDYYVKVVDDKTDEVIKEIPSKKLMDTYAAMMEFVGLLVDKKV